MFHLEPPDSHFFSAAVGWLGLSNPTEARLELERLSSGIRKRPDVLELQWAIDAAEKNWTASLETAREILKVAPRRAAGWLHQAYALRRVEGGGLQAAWDALFPAAEEFPDEPIIPYNLSCYACQLGRLDEARRWLQRAMEIGSKEDLKRMGASDEDLRPLWVEIRKM